MKTARTVPLKVAVLLIVAAASSVTFAMSAAMTEYAFIKPFVKDMVFKAPNLKSESFTLEFDPATLRYPKAQLTVKNYADQTVSATINIYLYDTSGNTIASGNTEISVNAGISATATIDLSWSSGNAVNVTSGRIVIKE